MFGIDEMTGRVNLTRAMPQQNAEYRYLLHCTCTYNQVVRLVGWWLKLFLKVFLNI